MGRQRNVKTKEKAQRSGTGIKDRLTRGFISISLLASIAAVIGCIMIFVISSRYDHAMQYYGFSQGDIGKAMTSFAETRSALRFAIGYSDQEAIDSALKVYREKQTALDGYMKDVWSSMVTDAGKASYNQIVADMEGYWELADEILELGASTDVEKSRQAQKLAAKKLSPQYEVIYADMLALMNVNVQKGDETQAGLTVLKWILVLVVAAIIVISVAVSIKIGDNIAKGIANPIAALSDRLHTLAEGDLSSEFPVVETKDEVASMVGAAAGMSENLKVLIDDLSYLLTEMSDGNFAIRTRAEERYVGEFNTLLMSIRSMNTKMNDTLHEIEAASDQVSAGSTNMAEGAQSLAEGATDQAGSVEELQATFTTITEHVENTSKRVEESYLQASQYAEEADSSRHEMEAMVEAMARINETSQKISNIVSDIEDIASQTNLLSLNASIEAARAGEAGKGFAVVADQIRKLAEQSAQSAVNTRELIEGSLKEITEGNKAADNAATAIEHVVVGVKSIAEASKELSEITKEQALAMEQAEEGINQISEIIQQNSATAQETSATSEELSAQAVSMNELVAQFTLKD